MRGFYLTRVFVFIIVSFPLLLSLSSCFLDGAGRAGPRPSSPYGAQQLPTNGWKADAFPGFACPADNISLKWDVADPFCRDTGPSCQTLTVTDSEGLLGTGYTSRELTGTYENGSVSDLDSWSGAGPMFTFSVTPDSPTALTWDDRVSQVQIVQNPPAPAASPTFSATSVCDPVSGSWSLVDFRLDMQSDAFINSTKGLGPCVRITSVCYNGSGTVSYDPIIVSVVGGGAMAARTLSRGDCVDGLNLRPDLHYQVVPDPSIPLLERMGGACVAGSTNNPLTPAPEIQLVFSLGCDTTLDECGN